MEVHGKSATGGFGDDSKLYCQACDRDDILEPAFGFCQNCDEHLCESCYRYHKKPAPTRHHVLLDQYDMPKEQRQGFFKSSDETDFCLKHGDERVIYFCSDHHITACHICITLDHRLCKVIYIPDAAVHVIDSEEYRRKVAQLQLLKIKCQSIRQRTEDLLNETEVNHNDILKEIRRIRQQINKALDKMEKDVISKAEQFMMSENRKLEKRSNTCEEIASNVNEITAEMNTLVQAKHLNKLFIKVKHTHGELKSLISKGETIWHYETPGIEMIPNQGLVDMLSKHETNIGELLPKGSRKTSGSTALVLNYWDKIPLAICSSVWEEWSTLGIEVISPDKLIIIGTAGKTGYASLMDVSENEIISAIELSSGPREIKRVNENQVAVTVENGIQILTISNTEILHDRDIKVDDLIVGIACYEESIVVTVYGFPGKVMMLNIEGEILNNFDADGSLYNTSSVSVSNDGEGIFVTDGKHSVTKIDFDGNVVCVYKEDGYYEPNDLLEMTDGTFIICFLGSSKLARISSSCYRCELAGLEETEIWNPYSIRFCNESKKLYLLCGSSKEIFCDTIKVFDVEMHEM